MKRKSNLSELQKDIEGTTSIPSLVIPKDVETSATVEYRLQNKEMTLKDKALLCERNTQTLKSSETLVRESISKEKVFYPFWNQQCKEIASTLWLPTRTDLQDLALKSSSSLLSGMVEKSWFSTKLFSAPNKNLPKTCSISSTFSHVGCTDLEVTKSKLIRIYPKKEQKKLFLEWINSARFVFNTTLAYIKDYEGKVPSWMETKKILLKTLPSFCDNVPFQIKGMQVKLAYESFFSSLKSAKKNKVPANFNFKRKRESTQSVYIPKSALSDKGLYPRISGKGLVFKESLPADVLDSRLVYHNGKFYVMTPRKENISYCTENQSTNKIVSIDPGVRTFSTFYSQEHCGFIGKGDFSRVQRLAYYCDDLISRRSKIENRQKKLSFDKAISRMRDKVKHLVDEMHKKTALFFVKNFDVILLPTFEVSNMVLKSKRKIRAKSVRAMLTWSHYRFKMFLKNKAFEHGKIVHDVCEAYTSKTHPETGEIKNIGGAKYIRLLDGNMVDRDLVGGRNILLRSLVDTPEKFIFSQLSKC